MYKVETKVTKKQCQTCTWCVKSSEMVRLKEFEDAGYVTFKRIFGFCHRHGPARVEGSGITCLQWPSVEAEDWCGEWCGQQIGPPEFPSIEEIRNGIARSSGHVVKEREKDNGTTNTTTI